MYTAVVDVNKNFTHIQLFNNYRLLGRFAPIFYFNCKHVLIVNIEKQRSKKCRGFYKKFADFQDFKKFYKNKKALKRKFFEF